MPDGTAQTPAFLARAGWDDARSEVLAGDASARRYWRLRRPRGDTAILMDAGGDADSTRRFLRIAAHLSTLGLSAPACLAQDTQAGLLLLEDFGDDIFARLLERNHSLEDSLYSSAIDALAVMARAPVPDDLPVFRSPQLVQTAAAAVGWYPGVTDGARGDILGALAEALTPADAAPRRLCVRDFHAENLVWLPERDGPRRAGLLDFQDAVAGHPAYDLVSLLTDARRDVPSLTRDAMTARYLAETGFDATAFDADAAALSAQRNLRILTQFARLALRDGKPGYLPLMPRVWVNLSAALDHPALPRLRSAVVAAIRPPDAALIERIRSACARSR
jgi:aminoglycoside/choline kinase family phosphotransferase